MCVCALIIGSKAGSDSGDQLKALVYAVRLENATMYGPDPNKNPEPPAVLDGPDPNELPTKDFTDVFNAVLDPFFDEDVYMGTDERFPLMPFEAIGDY